MHLYAINQGGVESTKELKSINGTSISLGTTYCRIYKRVEIILLWSIPAIGVNS